MKANEYIKKNGLEEARKLLEMGRGFVKLSDDGSFHTDELKHLVELHENLELLGGIQKGRDILNGAPDGSDSFVLWTGRVRYINSSTKCIFSDKSNEWLPANVMVLNLMISFDALKGVIADVEACQ